MVAGLSLLAIAIPEQIATAHLIGMPARAGLVSFVAGPVGGSVVFALVGSTTTLSSGADSTIAPIIAQGVVAAQLSGASAVAGIGFASLVVGVAVVAAALARASWIADLLSLPLVEGVFLGIAVTIAVSQLASAMGLVPPHASTVLQLVELSREVLRAHLLPSLIALGVVVVIVVGERLAPGAPMPLVALIVATIVVVAGHLTRRVAVLGPTRGGLGRLGVAIPPGHALAPLVGAALTAAFVVLVQTAATQRYLSSLTATTSSLDLDLAGVGLGSVVAGLVGAFAVDASPPRSVLVARAGGRSQLAGLVAAGGVALLAALGMGLLTDAPIAAFAGTLLVVASRLVRPDEWRSLWQTSRVEAVLAGIAALSVVALGVERGVVVAVGLALAFRLRGLARPEVVELVQEPGTDHWIDPRTAPGQARRDILVLAVRAPLWFGDAEVVERRILEVTCERLHARHGVSLVVIDADGIPDADVTGARSMRDLEVTCGRLGVQLVWARLLPGVARTLLAQGVHSAAAAAPDVATAVQQRE